jgi:hypothetical protein
VVTTKAAPLYENWIVDDHMIHIGNVLKALNAAELADTGGEISGYTVLFHPSENGIEVSAGDELEFDGRQLLGRLVPIDTPGAWSFIAERRKLWWSVRRNRWASHAECAVDRKAEAREQRERERQGQADAPAQA